MSFFTPHLASKNELPDNLSGIQANPKNLLSTVSVSALLRTDGWEEGAEEVNRTVARYEEVMAA